MLLVTFYIEKFDYFDEIEGFDNYTICKASIVGLIHIHLTRFLSYTFQDMFHFKSKLLCQKHIEAY